MDAQRELLELAKEMLGYSDLTPEQIEWAARIEALATTLAAREDGWVLVPSVADLAMTNAGHVAAIHVSGLSGDDVQCIYAAMISAAPPAQGTGEGT